MRGVSVLLFASLVANGLSYEVVDEVEGILTAEETKHYNVESSEVLVVALLSYEGDADLYISRVSPEPNYSNYQFSSSSCGLDLVVVPTSKGAGSQTVYMSVVGDGRYKESSYSLVIISPSSHDIDKYQVWERDPETGRQVLIVEYDPLQIANDHSLNLLLDELHHFSTSGKRVKDDSIKGPWRSVKYVIELFFFLFLEILSFIL